MKFGLLGQNISYSLSPRIFECIDQKLSLNISYELFDVQANEINKIIDKLKINELQGLNVTKPFKEEVIQYCDELAGDAKDIQSVNTLVSNNGRIIGYNTDTFGFEQLFLESQFKKVQPIYIFGNGGSAKAVVHTLEKYHIPFRIVKRQSSKRVIINENEILYKDVLDGPGLIIQTTTVGLNDTDPLLIEPNKLKEKCVIDLIYNHPKTVHMQLSKSSVNGLTMLIFQAIQSFSIWTNNFYSNNQELIDYIKEVLKNELYR